MADSDTGLTHFTELMSCNFLFVNLSVEDLFGCTQRSVVAVETVRNVKGTLSLQTLAWCCSVRSQS